MEVVSISVSHNFRQGSSSSGKDQSTSGVSRGLPEHWKRGRLLALLFVIAVTALVTWLLRAQASADQLDGWWLRARFGLAEATQPATSDPDVVLVLVDDKALAQWIEPQVFWGSHFAKTLDQLTRAKVRLVGLDWIHGVTLTDVVTEETKEAKIAREVLSQYDARWAAALSRVPDVVWVKQQSTDPLTGKLKWMSTTPELLYAREDAALNPEQYLGYAELVQDGGVVASQVPVLSTDDKGGHELSFAARIVERYSKGRSQLRANAWRVEQSRDSRYPSTWIPLREDGSILINYRLGSETNHAFKRYSIVDVAAGRVPASALRDKIVLIGTSYTNSNDQHAVALPEVGSLTRPRIIPGVEIQANLVRNLLSAQPVREPNSLQMWLLALLPGALGALAFLRWRWVLAALLCVGLAVVWLGLSAALFLSSRYALPTALPLISLLLAGGMMGGYRALGEERERQQVQSLWGRYQDERLIEYLLAHPEARGGQGNEKQVTVLFADLKNFTKTVEHLPPPEAIQMLNRYLELMTQVVRNEYGGFVDKYLGDGLMAQWGAPEMQPLPDGTLPTNHAEVAVRACLELERRTREMTQTIAGKRDVTFGLRLTLHTGRVVHGWVGAERIELTIIGDNVNVCARLQETAKELGCEFLISETTYAEVRDWVQIGKQSSVEIRGRTQPLQVYEVVGNKRANSENNDAKSQMATLLNR